MRISHRKKDRYDLDQLCPRTVGAVFLSLFVPGMGLGLVLRLRAEARGFHNGPLLPIYGFGALSVLVFTLPVAQNPALVFFSGMAVATLLEYTTGTVLRSYTVPASSAAQRQPRHRRKNPTAET